MSVGCFIGALPRLRLDLGSGSCSVRPGASMVITYFAVFTGQKYNLKSIVLGMQLRIEFNLRCIRNWCCPVS